MGALAGCYRLLEVDFRGIVTRGRCAPNVFRPGFVMAGDAVAGLHAPATRRIFADHFTCSDRIIRMAAALDGQMVRRECNRVLEMDVSPFDLVDYDIGTPHPPARVAILPLRLII